MLYSDAAQMPVSAHGGPIGQLLGVVIHVAAGEGDPYNTGGSPFQPMLSLSLLSTP